MRSPQGAEAAADFRVALLSCYELGHQPLGLALPLAHLAAAGIDARPVDLALQPLRPDELGQPLLVAISTPMHTALRVGVAAARQLRREIPGAGICFHGLYAGLNAGYLFGEGLADYVIAGESAAPLAELARALCAGGSGADVPGVTLPGQPVAMRPRRPPRAVPRRSGLPAPGRYAHLEHAGRRLTAAAVESSSGCRYRCRHCPVTPVYDGRFFAVPVEDVMADVEQLVAAGVGHLTFADPDFLNGPTHALRVVRSIHGRWPALSFDFTARVEHLVRHADLLPELVAGGALFAVTAVECLSDRVLDILDKGHSRADVARALHSARAAGLALRPSLLPFTPWTTLEDYGDLLCWIAAEALVEAVDPVHLSLRLLLPPGSPLAGHPQMKPHLRGLAASDFSWRWSHPDARMDALQAQVHGLVSAAAADREPPAATYGRIHAAWAALSGEQARNVPVFSPPPARHRDGWPRLSEPWYC